MNNEALSVPIDFEARVKELEEENEKLKAALKDVSDE
jgi:hypothetical protein